MATLIEVAPVRFDYLSHAGTPTRREAEPLRLVTWGRRWFLVAWDTAREDWRTYRVDRMALKTPNGRRFPPREPPADDLATYVARGVSTAAWRHRARLVVHAPADVIADRLPPAVGPVESIDEHTCQLSTGADSVETLALWAGMLDADFDVIDSPDLVARLNLLAHRYARASARSPAPSPAPH